MGKWEEKKIGDFAKVKSSKRIFKEEYVSEGVSFYRSKEIVELSKTNKTNSELFISRGRYNEIKRKFGVPNKGDMLLTSVGTIGQTWIVDDREFYYKDGNLTQIEKNDNFEMKFLRYYFRSPLFFESIFNNINGTAYNALTITKINALKIPLPPLSTQKRIVAKLDALFSRIDKSIALLEENIQYTKDLMASVLDEEFGAISDEGVVVKKLGEVCQIVGGGTPKTGIAEYWNGNVKWLSPTDLPPIGIISDISDTTKTITKLGLDKSSARLLPKGSLVFSSRASIGKIGICKVDLATNQGFTNFIMNDNIEVYYLAYVLKQNTKSIENLSNSTTFKEVNKTSIRNFKIPLPSIEKQKKFVDKIIKIEEKSNQLLTRQTEKLKHLQSLKSSLLDMAFKGELV